MAKKDNDLFTRPTEFISLYKSQLFDMVAESLSEKVRKEYYVADVVTKPNGDYLVELRKRLNL